ncbi:MAG: ATP-dependent DNA helicase RecG [Patescibacteria group bacterium]|nr:ATP-dependent DNA helicase RecG [Patescibacteria group bacterium]
MKLDLDNSVSALGRVGQATAKRLKKLGIETVKDLIFYYPVRWEDWSQISVINDLKPDTTVTIKAKLQLINNRRSFKARKIITEGLIADETGLLKVIWFNQPFLTKNLKPGDEIYFSGKVDFDKYSLQLVNPAYEKVRAETIHTARLVPMYSLTDGLSQKQLRFLIKAALVAADQIKDYLPADIRSTNKFVGLKDAILSVHFPQNQQILNEAIRRLKFDDIFLFELKILKAKNELEQSLAEPIKFNENETKRFVDSLPFELTNDQRQSAWKIISDLAKDRPMNRLLEGDVGSGKTVVASIAMLNAAFSQKQSVLMAPTEILAYQHYETIVNLFKKFDVKTCLLTKSWALLDGLRSTKSQIIDGIRNGKILIVVGTQSLIQESILFHDLGLAVIDEQHRFGVNQRLELKNKSGNKQTVPHLLTMTATPIPRSLALTLYGDLDISIIRQLPKNRKKIETKIVESEKREEVYQFIKNQIQNGRQTFVVCPLIDPSDKLGVRSVTEEYDKLVKKIFPTLKISMLHGKLKSSEKEKVMADFSIGKSDILVTTSVIEVGVDVPNATVMMIEGADRFGLAQLHQFRGRVGRAEHQSYCFLLTESRSEKTKSRLTSLVTAADGFELAELDLQSRGPGEIYGFEQSGWPEFKMAKLTDLEIIELGKYWAEALLKKDPELVNYPGLFDLIFESVKLHLE